MKKVNKEGFVLAETIAVAVVVITALIVIYTQFISIDNSYYRTFNYNNVNNLYLANSFKEFMESDTNTIYDEIKDGALYVDVTSCSSYFIEYMYCERLIDAMNAKRVIVANNNVTELSYNIDNYDFSENLKNYIKNSNSREVGYRLIIEFEDNTIAGLLIRSNELYKSYIIGDVVTLSTGNDTTSKWYVIEDSGEYSSSVKLFKADNTDSNTYAFDEENHRLTENNSYCIYPNIGCDAYAANGTTVTEDSSVKINVDNYALGLGLGNALYEARLITSTELMDLGCEQPHFPEDAEDDFGTCPSYIDWLHNSSFWIINEHDTGNVVNSWALNKVEFESSDPLENRYFGIRPVIVVSKNIVRGDSNE